MNKHHILQEDHQNSSGSSLAMSSSFGTTTPERHSSFSQESESAVASTLHSPSSSDYSPTITPSMFKFHCARHSRVNDFKNLLNIRIHTV